MSSSAPCNCHDSRQLRAGVDPESLTEAASQIASECAFRALEWCRAGDVKMAEAFARVGAVVEAIRC